MLVWAVASQKGGVGKTTTVASLAGWLQKEQLRVLVIDTDPHASLTSYLGLEDNDAQFNLFDLYAASSISREVFLRTVTGSRHLGLDIIPSSMTLATIDRQLSGRQGVGRILAKSLALVEDCYDVVLIDCPPVLGALMVNALVASTTILVPTQTEFLALKGLSGMMRTFEIMSSAHKDLNLDYLVIPTMFDKRTRASHQSLDFMRSHYDNVWGQCIPIDTLFRESSAKRLPLPLMDSGCRGAMAYRALLFDIVRRELEKAPSKVTAALKALLEESAAGEEKIKTRGRAGSSRSAASLVK